MIEIDNLCAWYARTQALFGASMSIPAGETVGLVGTNGAGRTTLVRSLLGLVRATGSIRVAGNELTMMPTYRRAARHGITVVPEGRGMFSGLSARENLELGHGRLTAADLDLLHESFPELTSRLHEKVSKLSGGEQQMVALCRALLRQPKVLILDEPSLGLAPVVVDRVYEHVSALKSHRTTVLLIEQDVSRARDVCDRLYFIAAGSVLGGASVADEDQVGALIQRAFADTRRGDA